MGALMALLRFYWLVFVGGGVLMALEIISSRLLSPHFGSSVYVWGSIISTFLAALSLGYTVGGRLADRYPHLRALGRLLIGAALFQAILLVSGEDLVAWLGEVTGGSPVGTLLTTAVLFGPLTVLLGMVSPWAIRIAAHDLGDLGHTAGRLYAVSTAGSLVGTLAATFLLIPYLQLAQILGLLLGITALTGALALADEPRREALPIGLALVLTVLVAVRMQPVTTFEDVIYRRITPYQTLEVVEREGARFLVSDNTLQAGIRLADGSPALSYARLMPMAAVFKPDLDNALLLGMGAGNSAYMLRRVFPELEVDYVDIDPAVPQVATRFLEFTEGPNDRIHIRDARRFLATTDRQWDFILIDTYIGRSVPFHLTTTEFFRLVKARLAPDGVLVLNLASGLEQPFPKAIARTLSDHFQPVYAFAARELANVELFATRDGAPMSAEEMLARARDLDRRVELELPVAEIVERQLLELDLELQQAPLLTDAFAPVERLVVISAAEMPVTESPPAEP